MDAFAARRLHARHRSLPRVVSPGRRPGPTPVLAVAVTVIIAILGGPVPSAFAAEPPPTLPDQPDIASPTMITRIPWGSGPSDLAIRLESVETLPSGPYLGPGGFAVDDSGRIWISDSPNRQLKGFKPPAPGAPDPNPVIIDLPTGRLGDVACAEGRVAVVSAEAGAILVVDPDAPREKRVATWKVGFRSPGRLLPTTTACGGAEGTGAQRLWLLDEPGAGTWMVGPVAAARHPVAAIEPVGSPERLFGMLYDFDPLRRRLIVASWSGPGADAETIGLLVSPDASRIAYSLTLADDAGRPVLGVVTASAPHRLQILATDADGNTHPTGSLPLFRSVFLPGTWKRAGDGAWYGTAADLTGLTIYRARLGD